METIATGSVEEYVKFTRVEIFYVIKHRLNDGLPDLILYLEEQLSEIIGRPLQVAQDMKASLSLLFVKIRTRWQKANRTEAPFLKQNNEWLNAPVSFPAPIVSGNNQTDCDLPSTSKCSGRPSGDFPSLSERSKRRRTQSLRETWTPQELAYATQMSLRSAGQLAASKVVYETATSPSTASKYRQALESTAKSEKTLSAEAALSIYVEYKFTKSQYQGLRATSKENNCKLYPSYKKLAEAKKHCYPPNTAITITENMAEVQLQALLDHTTDRILLWQEDVIRSLDPANVSHMQFIFKWGCDGSSGQSEYKQTFEDERASDANVFFTSIVPLQLISVDPQSKAAVVIWKNPRPSSPRFCRPVRLQFLHESTESTVNEVQYIENQIKSLVPFENIMHGKEILVSYNMAFTMIDGKVCNAVTSTKSAQRCYLCGSTSKDFNNIDEVLQKEVNEENLKFGLSTLHAWIRFFECCLHLSYKLVIKKWRARSAEEKEMVETRKKIIQKGFSSKLGLIVDRPKPGYGSTNDGNTARRFFEKSKTSALITSLDIDLIERFHVILQVISSGHEINTGKFHNYTLATARKFVELYPWYYMPTSVHKLLIHGPQIIAHALLPIGQLSEEAQEARNKDIKRYREDFSRKCSRVKTMEDVFKRLLVTSDPYISSVRKLPQKKMKSLSKEAIKLLHPPEMSITSRLTVEHSDVDSDSEDSESDTDSDV